MCEIRRVLKCRSLNAIRNKLMFLGIPTGPRPEIDVAEFKRLMGVR